MHLARVVGTLHATQKDPALVSAKLLILQPIDSSKTPTSSTLVAVDTLSAGEGEIVFYTTAYEAVMPWQALTGRKMALIDASIIGIVDRIDCEGGQK